MFEDLKGRTAVVFGVANKRSIAWAIAQGLHAAGANLRELMERMGHLPRQTAPSCAKTRRDAERHAVRRAGLEPATRCLEGTIEASRCVALRRSTSHIAAQM